MSYEYVNEIYGLLLCCVHSLIKTLVFLDLYCKSQQQFWWRRTIKDSRLLTFDTFHFEAHSIDKVLVVEKAKSFIEFIII